MSHTVLQLGCGMQGRASLADLLGNASISKVIVADASDEVSGLGRLHGDPRIVPVKADIRDERVVRSLMEEADAVIELLPGAFTLRAAQLAVEALSHIISDGFGEE